MCVCGVWFVCVFDLCYWMTHPRIFPLIISNTHMSTSQENKECYICRFRSSSSSSSQIFLPFFRSHHIVLDLSKFEIRRKRLHLNTHSTIVCIYWQGNEYHRIHDDSLFCVNKVNVNAHSAFLLILHVSVVTYVNWYLMRDESWEVIEFYFKYQSILPLLFSWYFKKAELHLFKCDYFRHKNTPYRMHTKKLTFLQNILRK